MKIETRNKLEKQTNHLGEILAVRVRTRLTAIQQGESMSTDEADAVCINGVWFTRAASVIAEHLDAEWNALA